MFIQLEKLLALAAAICLTFGVAHAAQIEFSGGEHAVPRGSLACGASEPGQITESDPTPFNSGGTPLHSDSFTFTLGSRQVVTLNVGASLFTIVYVQGGSSVSGFAIYDQSVILNAGTYTIYVIQGSTTQVLPVDYTLNITCAAENPMASASPGSLTIQCTSARGTGSGKLPLFAQPMDGLNARGDEEFEEVVTLDPATLYELTASARTRTLSGIPLGDGTVSDFLLTPYEVFTADAQIYGFDGQNKAHLPRPDVQFYQGTSTTDPDAHLIFSVTNGTEGRLTLRRPGLPPMAMTPVDTRGSGLHLLARVAEFDGSRTLCEGEVVAEQPPGNRRPLPSPQAQRGTGTLDSEILVDVANYAYVNAFGSNSTAATTYMANVYGAASGIYLRDTNNLVRIKQLVVWTVADPIDGASTSAQLTNYASYNFNNRPMGTFPRDLAQFMSSKPGLGGRAYLNGLCSSSIGYGVNNIYGSYSFPNPNEYIWDINVVAHEMGHNFGSSHTHCYVPPIDCCYDQECSCTTAPQVGTVMSYCHLNARISMNFHQRVIDNIRPKMENASCVDAYVPEGANYFVVTNPGNAPVSINVALETPQPWLTFSQTSFTLNARASHQVMVEVDCDSGRGGTTNHTIQITGNATNGMQSIPLTVVGLGGGPPTPTPTPGPSPTPTFTPAPTTTPTPSPTPCPMTTELLINGSFDLGAEVGWTEVNAGFAIIGEWGFAHSGTFHCFLGGYTEASEETVSQFVTLPSGSNPILSFFLEVAGTEDSTDNRLEVRVDGTPVRTFLHAEASTIKTYTQFTVPLAAYADGGMHTIQFRALTGDNTSSTWFIDTASVTACIESVPYDGTDTDGDGFTDQVEVQYMSNHLDPDSVPDFGNYDGTGETNAGDALGLYRNQSMRGGSPAWDVDNDGDVDVQDAISLWRWSIGRPGYEVIPMAPPEP